MAELRGVKEFAEAVAAAFRFLLGGRPEHVPFKLATVGGVVACAAAVNAAANPPPAGSVVLTTRAWLGAVIGTFFGGLLSIWAGFCWVGADIPRRATAGRAILAGALVLLVIAISLSDAYDNTAIVFKLVLDAAMDVVSSSN